MKPIVLVCIFLFAASASGQWLETTIDVPDSLCGGLVNPQSLLYCPLDSTVYVGGANKGWLIALDGATGRKVAGIAAGYNVRDMCYASQVGKLYTADKGDGCISVLDAATNALLTRISVGSYGVVTLCYNSARNKVYCADWGSDCVSAIDCATDSVVATLSVPTGEEVSLLYNPAHDKLYEASSRGLYVIDCGTDSVTASPPVGTLDPPLCLDPGRDEVYCATNNSRHSLLVIDCNTDSIVRTIELPHLAASMALYYDSCFDKVYSSDGVVNSISIIDPATGLVIATYNTTGGPSGAQHGLCHNPVSGKVYCATTDVNDGWVTVLDCSTATVRRQIRVGRGAWAVCCSPGANLVFCANYYDHSVSVIDGAGDSVCSTVTLNGGPKALCWSRTSNKAYCANEYSDNVTVIDGATNARLRSAVVGDQPWSLCYNPANDRVYCGVSGAKQIVAFDCVTDSILASISVPNSPRAMCYNPDLNRVYCAMLGKVAVIDCARNLLLSLITTGTGTDVVCYNPASRKVYAANPGDNTVSVIDCSTSTVRATIQIQWRPSALCCNPRDNKVYCLTDRTVTIIDGASDHIIAAVGHHATPATAIALCYNSTDNKVYCSCSWTYDGRPDYTEGWVSVFSGESNGEVARIQIPGTYPRPGSLQHDPQNDKVYCIDEYYGVVHVIDGVTNGIVRSVTLPAGPKSFAWNSSVNRTYVNCVGVSKVAVIRDSLVACVQEEPSVAGTKHGKATVVRRVLFLPTSDIERPVSSILLDITGRKVLDLWPGANDVSAIAPGVYFVREQGRMRKVVVAR
jgi:YVTN family beta-propeller protein